MAVVFPRIWMASSNELCLELPPDVPSSEGENVSEESTVTLPDALETSDCCKKKCLTHLSAAAKLASAQCKEQLVPLDLAGKNMVWFHQLLNMNRDHPEGPFRRSFHWQGTVVCLKCFSELTTCPPKKIREFLKAIAQGECVAPVDGRTRAKKRLEPKRENVDSFFAFLYEHLAEPLANVQLEDYDLEQDSCDQPGFVAAPDWLEEHDILTSLAFIFQERGKTKIQKRFLPTMTAAELFDLYQEMHEAHSEKASQSTFKRAWSRWQAVLGVRPPTVHSRCDDCAKYSAVVFVCFFFGGGVGLYLVLSDQDGIFPNILPDPCLR